MTRYFAMITLLSGLLFSISSVNAQRRPKDRILDRKTFIVQMIPQEQKKKAAPFEDVLSFRSNRMGSRQMQIQNGFQKGEYAIYEKKDVIGEMLYKFEGINKNAKEFSLKWEGQVFGENIEGTAIISKKGKIKQQYSFKGTIKK